MQFQSKNPQYHYLKDKWNVRHQKIQNNFLANHQDLINWLTRNFPLKHIMIGSLGSLLLLSSPSGMMLSEPQQNKIVNNDEVVKATDNNIMLANAIAPVMPAQAGSLTPTQESQLTTLLSRNLGFKVLAELDGKRLNTNYGLIGGEQHLYRFPGDTLYKHLDSASDWAMYADAGIAPHLGAWGYFAPSEKDFTETDKMRERYYIAVQTFLSPGFAENVDQYRDFFKYRKMLVVNPITGRSVVTVIGDAGPGEYTGKQFGGSPTVMHDLGLAGGSRKGGVLVFFIDDPANKIPLGPIKTDQKVIT